MKPRRNVTERWYVVDVNGRLWHAAGTFDEARLTVFAQGYTIVRVDPDGTWEYIDA